METFSTDYQRLNPAQKAAVDTIEGPLMVIAGPGTGKTQLLSMRAANILRSTDVLPGNILCLTFSESGERAMRQRLARLIGQQGYQIPVFTFHGFGSDIMNRYPEYFYRGAQYRAADELKQYEILQQIFSSFDHGHVLSGLRDDKFTQLRDTHQKIKELKQAGFTPQMARLILDDNDAFMELAEPLCDQTVGGATISAKMIPQLQELLKKIQPLISEETPAAFVQPISILFAGSLERALQESAELSGREATKPLTRWKNEWRDSAYRGVWRFSARDTQTKLRAVIDVYEQYQKELESQCLFDYDDMIMQVVNRLENTEELRNNLQEQYLYLMVDEYQDTNQAQLRMVRALADHPVHEGSPNLMVVGDDDQGVYKFQGADLSNMLEFLRHYPGAKLVTLVDNYRSTQDILDVARAVITQGRERMEEQHDQISKTLTARNTPKLPGIIERPVFDDCRSQYQWIAGNIASLIEQGIPAREIAVLGRSHHELKDFAAYLRAANIPVDYEKRENILESDHIARLTKLCELVNALAHEQYDLADTIFPEVLSYEFWRLPVRNVWHLSMQAYRDREPWFAIMDSSDNEDIQEIYDFLTYAASEARLQPLEHILDIIVGTPDNSDDDAPRSPYFDFYFGNVGEAGDNTDYLTLLSHLITLRRHLRDFRPDQRLMLRDFMTFVQLHRERGLGITASHAPGAARDAIQVMTAHKSKGLEFEAVFILSCLETTWGQPKRSHRKLIKYPPNLRLEPAGDELDDWLRLFYVAITRAKRLLYVCTYNTDESGEDATQLSFLDFAKANELIRHNRLQILSQPLIINQLLTDWRMPHYIALTDRETDLADQLERYRLSATHLDNFLDVEHGGPRTFFLRNLLQFPMSMRTSLAYGSAMHAALSAAHGQVNEHGRLTDPDAIKQAFAESLHEERMSKQDAERTLKRGQEALNILLSDYHHLFRPGQISERGFGGVPVTIGPARLNGKLDLIEIDGDEVTVSDYKTGKSDGKTSLNGDIKLGALYKYRRQLLFYKLLVEQSNEISFKDKKVRQGRLIFVEPNKQKEIVEVNYEIEPEELARLQALVPIVWQHIMDLNFPDVSDYEKSARGVRQFENDLLDGKL